MGRPRKQAPVKKKAGASVPVEKPDPDLPATFDEWTEDSEVVCNLSVHVYTISPTTDAIQAKLIKIAEDECAKIVKLLRSRIKTKSKKLGLGCRIM